MWRCSRRRPRRAGIRSRNGAPGGAPEGSPGGSPRGRAASGPSALSGLSAPSRPSPSLSSVPARLRLATTKQVTRRFSIRWMATTWKYRVASAATPVIRWSIQTATSSHTTPVPGTEAAALPTATTAAQPAHPRRSTATPAAKPTIRPNIQFTPRARVQKPTRSANESRPQVSNGPRKASTAIAAASPRAWYPGRTRRGISRSANCRTSFIRERDRRFAKIRLPPSALPMSIALRRASRRGRRRVDHRPFEEERP